MECPACGKTLVPVAAGDIEVDVCRDGCGGVWFDRDEILKFDEPHEFATSEVLKSAEEHAGVKIDPAMRKHCPRCAGEPLVRQFFDIKNEVQIDQCWNCAGIWLDPGEINTIRNQYQTFEERAQAVNAYADRVLHSAEEKIAEHTAQDVAAYNEETKNLLRGFLFGFKKLLGLDNPYDGL